MTYIQAESRKAVTAETPANYGTDDAFIECLGYCDLTYTSDNINDDSPLRPDKSGRTRPFDFRVPPVLRQSATSPFDGIQCLDLDMTSKSLLKHASAIIPASNGAYWLIYPIHRDTLAYNEETREQYATVCRQSVQYYMPSGDRYITVSGTVDELYQDIEITTLGNATDYALSKDALLHGHPCGATYLNMVMPVEIDDDHLKSYFAGDVPTQEQKPAAEAYLKEFFGMFRNEKGVHCVDVLVCYGGYHWLRKETNAEKLYLARDGTVRFFVPSLRINCTKNADSDYSRVEERGQYIVTRSIACGNTLPNNWWFFSYSYKLPPIGVGASLIQVSEHVFRAVGGVGIKGTTTYTLEKFAGTTYSAYPWGEYTISAAISSAKTTVNGEDIYSLYLGVRINDIRKRTDENMTSFVGYKNYACFNPMSKSTYAQSSTTLHVNHAPMMYPMLYAVDECLIAHGGEWIGDRTGHTADTLSQYMKGWFVVNQSEPHKTDVCHIPLINDQFLLQRGGHKTPLYAYPLNVSGAYGMCEGAVAVPEKNCLNILGGCVSKYSEHCYSVREGLADESKRLDYVPTIDTIVHVLAPDYAPENIRAFPLDSKRIIPKSTNWPTPYVFGIDTLKKDYLFSQCVQLADTDYFVCPSSYYKYPAGAKLPKAALLKRVTPLTLDNPQLSDANYKEAYDRLHTRVRVSEVIGLDIQQETPATYADETLCYYGRASPAKSSMGAIRDTTGRGFWLYRLGRGSEPAKYHHIVILDAANLVWDDTLNAAVFSVTEDIRPKYPAEWI